jgi:hypothetical protein
MRDLGTMFVVLGPLVFAYVLLVLLFAPVRPY